MKLDNIMLGKCYEAIDRLAGRIGIDPLRVHAFEVIATDRVVAVEFKYWISANVAVGFAGHAICMRGDSFDMNIGLNIAIARAMRKAAKFHN